uniref:Non-specific serine/threonine protein kinase n=1 Tax=Steinernema glaseri TaxID=37863 RepID=A0A1I7Z9G4_9BILA
MLFPSCRLPSQHLMKVANSGGRNPRKTSGDDEWFDIINNTLKSILLEFRLGRPALSSFTKLLEDVNYLLDHHNEKIDKTGLLSLAAMSTQLLASEIMKKPELRAAISPLLRFVTAVFSSNGSAEVAFTYVEGLLNSVPHFAKETSTECVDAIHSVVTYTLSVPKLSEELYKPERKYVVGFLYSVMLNVFSDTSIDPSVRTKIGDLMCRMCQSPNCRQTTGFLLPGICQAMMKVICSLEIKSYLITLTALRIFTKVVTVVFQPDDIVEHDVQWTEQSIEIITQMITKIIRRLGASSDHRVRKAVLDSVCELYDICRKRFGSRIDESYLDLLVNLQVDPYESVNSNANSRLMDFRTGNDDFVIKQLSLRLCRLCSGLPYSVEKSLSGEPLILERIYAVMHALGRDDLERAISCSPHFTTQFVDGLASSIRIDMNRLKLSSENYGVREQETLCLYPLKYSITPEHINNIAKEFMKTDCSEIVFDHIVDRISADTYRKDKIGYFLLASCFLRTGKTGASSYFEVTLKTLRKLVNSIEADVKDEKIEDLQRQHSDDTCLAAIAVTSLGEAMAQIDPHSSMFQVRMLDTLYDVLQLCGSTNFVVKEAAEQALYALSKNENTTVSSLLYRFAPFIVHRLDIQSRDFLSNRRSPIILVELLDRCDDPALYEHVEFIATDLLNALDRFNQEWTTLILKGLLAYVRAIARWFPCLQQKANKRDMPLGDEDSDDCKSELDYAPSSPEDEEKEQIPKPILSVVDILLRAKHMISSPYLPVRLLVLDILNVSLRTVQHFESQLLPMIHQNWQGVLARIKLPWGDITPDYLIAATKAMEVVVTITELSGIFVYRKVVDEMWPPVEQYMRSALKSSRRKDSAFNHTSTFKYQLAVIKSCELFVHHLDLKTEDEHKKIEELLEAYSMDELQNPHLMKEAKRVLDVIRNFT